MTEQQHLTETIQENTERLNLLEKSLALEEKQMKRVMELSIQKKKDMEDADRKKLLQENSNNSNVSSILDLEDIQRKELVDTMVKTSTPSNGPVVKVLTNVQGNYI